MSVCTSVGVSVGVVIVGVPTLKFFQGPDKLIFLSPPRRGYRLREAGSLVPKYCRIFQISNFFVKLKYIAGWERSQIVEGHLLILNFFDKKGGALCSKISKTGRALH